MFTFVLIFAFVLGHAGARLVINGRRTRSTYDIVLGIITALIGCTQGLLYSL